MTPHIVHAVQLASEVCLQLLEQLSASHSDPKNSLLVGMPAEQALSKSLFLSQLLICHWPQLATCPGLGAARPSHSH